MGERRKKTIEDIPGVGPAISEKLREAGYNELMAIAVASPKDLAETCEISERKAKDIIEGARLCTEIGGFETCDDILERRKKVIKLSTGSEKLNDLMRGGLENQSVTQLFGTDQNSNSQVCAQLAVAATLPEDRGGFDSDVIIINSREDRFRPETIKNIAERMGADPEKTMRRIRATTAINSQHQIMLVEKASEPANSKKVRLLIIDSLDTHFRTEYVGRNMLPGRQQMLNRHMCDMRSFATQNNAVVLVTNGVGSDPIQPFGGHIMRSSSTFVLFLKRDKSGEKTIELVDSPNIPPGRITVSISEDGIRD